MVYIYTEMIKISKGKISKFLFQRCVSNW